MRQKKSFRRNRRTCSRLFDTAGVGNIRIISERVEYGAGKHSGKGAEIDDELFEMAQDFFDAALEYGLQKHVEHDNHGKHTKNHEAKTAGKAAENTCSEGAERDNDKFDEGAYAGTRLILR